MRKMTTNLVLCLLTLSLAPGAAHAGWPFGCGKRTHRGQQCGNAPVPVTACQVAPAAPLPIQMQAQPYPSPQATTVPAAAGNSYDFLGLLNAARAARRLSPLSYDPNLEAGASSNNAHQMAHGMGHFVMLGAGQCSAVAWDASMALSQWAASGPHAAILFDPAATACGFSCSGGYATANVSRGW